ncbi:6-bladed beta-propeller [Rhodohalobacter sulfatireducens]|uniref:6-bladed beta-propeller n=1 Tax=Rhodohalobacter sulfatireducens TaxID=2911366 RepID=A0ABS9KBJ1_9BACT|nr:6-bladed beta-propeller [Rhodohalobacter sulfatireducens]MCG2588219.1 6-bladed beta-propeller [Rhodohalobacter sulfatireducens]
MKINLGYIFLFILISCSHPKSSNIPERLQGLDNLSVYSQEAEPLFDVTFVSEISFGETEAVFLGSIVRSTAVDENGRVYIADFMTKTIHVYNTDGSYLGSLGREGRGPGEFQMIWVIRISGNYLHALDYQLQKISVFDLNNLEHERDINISIDQESDNKPLWKNRTSQQGLFYRVTNFYIRSDGNYLIIFSDEGVSSADNVESRTYEISTFNPKEGNYLEHEIFSFDWGGRVLVNEGLVMFNVPYKPGTQFDYYKGQLVYGRTEEMLFKFYDENGTYQRAFFYPYSKVKLTERDVLIQYDDEQTRNAIRTDELPTTWPAFDFLKVDDENRIWISTFLDDPDLYEWWIFKRSGKLLAKFIWPRDRHIEVVKDEYVYARETDKETGVQQIVKYRFEIK